MSNQSMSGSEIESAVEKFLSANHIRYHVTLLEKGTKSEDGWVHDEWRAKFFGIGHRADFSTEYRTGTGHRKNDVPQKPNAASVLHCLINDALALNMSFVEWCSDYGYDEDSIKAFKIYNACIDIGKKIQVFFDRTEVKTLRELLQDY